MAAWLFGSALMASLASAQSPATPSGWSRQPGPHPVPGVGTYSIAIPPGMRGGAVQGIDSQPADYEAQGLKLNMDFGFYGGRPECDGVSRCASIAVDGITGTLASRAVPHSEAPEAGMTRWLHVYFRLGNPIGARMQTSLVIWVSCASDRECETARRIIDTIDFIPG